MRESELTGAALDWAVAKCEGIELIGGRYNRLLVDGHMSRGQEMMAPYKPSTDWAQGGPIIEREHIDLSAYSNHWEARLWAGWEDNQKNNPPHIAAAKHRIGRVTQSIVKHGETPLIAAMRCYVASKLGDEVEVPEGL